VWLKNWHTEEFIADEIRRIEDSFHNITMPFHQVSNVEFKRRLRSSSTTALVVHKMLHETMDDRAFLTSGSDYRQSLCIYVTVILLAEPLKLSYSRHHISTNYFRLYHDIEVRTNYVYVNITRFTLRYITMSHPLPSNISPPIVKPSQRFFFH